MDMHMPVMSGADATRALKADPELAHIPVVVLTASAMKEDREKARAAGCDGFAAKPVQLHELFGEMKRVLVAHGTLDATRATTDTAPAAATGLDECMHELREEYMAQFGDVLAEFEALAAAGDTAGLGALGHRLRGNGAPYGFPEITDIGTQIEDLGNAGNLEDILPCIERLRQIRAEFQQHANA
jgi:CheY-like chemotaxis protein